MKFLKIIKTNITPTCLKEINLKKEKIKLKQ
jgi:hypothetical protein